MKDFPLLNCACRDGRIALGVWLSTVTPIVDAVASIAGTVGPDDADLLRRGCGMVVLAAERLAQPLGFPPGAILTRLPKLDKVLVGLADPGGRPALSHKGYWLTNVPPVQFTFTGSAYERFFMTAVVSQTIMRQAVHGLLAPVCAGDVRTGGSSVASRLLLAAAAVLDQAQQQFRDFNRGPDGLPGQTPAQFNEMRVWLPKTRIAGKLYGGPNAAYIVDMAGTDFLLGTADEHYERYVQGFVPELDGDERRLLHTYMTTPSVIDALSAAAGYSDAATMSVAPTDEVASRLRSSRNLLAAGEAARALYRSFCGGSGAHVGLINTHLTQYGAGLTPAERSALPVDPGTGVGGHGHEHTRRLHDTRRTNAAWKNFLVALKMTDTGPTAIRKEEVTHER
ncbi:hypothetical protein [Dactylosporangium roseum]